MIILSYHYELTYEMEETYKSFHDIEAWAKKLGYVTRIVRLNASGACETFLISTLFGGREDLLKIFRISKSPEQIEMDLLSPTLLISSYRGRWSFEQTAIGCRVQVKHVVDVNWPALSPQASPAQKKEIQSVRKVLRKIDQTAFSHLKKLKTSLPHALPAQHR